MEQVIHQLLNLARDFIVVFKNALQGRLRRRIRYHVLRTSASLLSPVDELDAFVADRLASAPLALGRLL